MKEVIILEVNEARKSHLVQDFLKSKKIDYQVLVKEPRNLTKQETKKTQKIDIFANYDQAIKNKEREQELKLWDSVDLDEELNKDGEWWN